MTPLLLLLALAAQDPVKVSSRLNDREIQAGQTTVLRVEVETEGGRARIEPFRSLPPGIELVSTRDYDQRQFSLQDGVRRFVTREFVLRARAAGRYRLPAIRVVVEGLTYQTDSHLLTVTSAPAGATGAPPGVLLRGSLSSDTVFLGEQVTLEVRAMFSQDARLRLRRAPEYHPPSPSRFWIHDLPDRRSPRPLTMEGDVYEVQSFRRAFFPLEPGRYQIPPARLDYEMRRGLLYTPETFTVESDTLPLVVRPLPDQGRPEGFRGAVGRYTVEGRLEPERVAAGDAAVLTVEVTGTGNIKALPPPSLPDMPGVEVFPPSEEAEVAVTGSGVGGIKRFNWVLIPREPGSVRVPAIPFVYFDPEAGRYETADVAPMSLVVDPVAGVGTSSDVALQPLKRVPGPADPLSFVGSGWFLALQMLPLLVLAWAVLVRRRRQTGGVVSRRVLRRRLEEGLDELEARAGDQDEAFFSDTHRFARSWLADRLAADPGRAASGAVLEGAGVAPGTIRAVRVALDRVASARYAPSKPDAQARRRLVRTLREALEQVDREAVAPRDVGRPESETAGTAATITLLLSVGLMPAGAGAVHAAPSTGSRQASAGSAFEVGVERFDAGAFGESQAAFERYLRERPLDPVGWYDLGLARHRAGSPAGAAVAWLRAVRLDPRDAATRRNLRMIGTAPELVARVTPPLRLRAEEAWLLAAGLWLLAGGALAVWVLRRRTAVGAVGLGAAVLAAALLVAGGLSTEAPPTLILLEAAPLRAGPTLRSEPLRDLAPGAGLVPLERQGQWHLVRTLGGRQGWVPAGAAERL